MARAKAVSWFNLVAGLVLGATAQPLVCEAVAHAGTNELVVAQVQGRASQVHTALSKAIDCHRQGEYEDADVLFKEVWTHFADLSPTEQAEFKRFSLDNTNALAARQNAHRFLGYAEKALAAADNVEATAQVKKASLIGQYMTAEDKLRLDDLSAQLRVVRSAPPPATTGPAMQPAVQDKPTPSTDPVVRFAKPPSTGTPAGAPSDAKADLARAKVKQARASLVQYNFDACQQLLVEAQAANVTYAKGEDTPAKVHEDLTKAMADPATLLLAARAALARKDYERADEYAKLSEKLGSSWSINLWADTPAKVMHDVQTARAQAKADVKKETPKAETPKTVQAEKPAPGMFDSVKGIFGGGSETEQSPYAKPATGVAAKPAEKTVTTNTSPAPAVANVVDNAEAARKLIKEGRAALKGGDFAKARQLADKAKALKPQLLHGDDTPELLLVDVGHAETVAKAAKVEKPAVVDAKPAKPDTRTQRDQALALLKKGREELAENKMDDALKSAMQAKALNVSWGLFEDTPDSLLTAVEKARARHNQDESAKVLTEGRRLLAQKDYDGALRAAYRAQTLHGSYYIWDLGDRPESLINDIEASRALARKIETPPDMPVVKKDNHVPPPDMPVVKKDDHRPPDTLVVKKDDHIPPPAPPPSTDVKPAPVVVTPPPPIVVAPPPPHNDEGIRPVVATEIKPVTPAVPPPPFILAGTNTSPTPAAVVQKPDVAVTPPVPPAKSADTNKVLALRLLDEARKLVKDGDLVGARHKCLEADKLRLAFTTNEESPGELMQKLAVVAGQRVQGLVAQASDLANDSRKSEAQRYEEAEHKLVEARDLTTVFGQDPQLVDGRLKWVRQMRSSALAAGASQPPKPLITNELPAEAAVDPTKERGLAMLNEARNRLREGKTTLARQKAEEACQDRYGVREEAYEVLREVDKEEFGQAMLNERRKFATVVASFNRQDYANARALLDTVNVKMLKEQQMEKLREMLETPEMQPVQHDTAVAQVQNPLPTGPESLGRHAPPTGPGIGHVQLTDTNPQESILKATEAMRVVQYDKLRKMGMEAQRQAAEKFRTGQADAAIETLKDYFEALNSEHLDTNQTAMLKRPVEQRLEQFQMLKEQDEFTNATARVAKAGKNEHQLHELKEQEKQKRVADLMKQFNAFYRDAKFAEANSYAQKALELDPDNGTAAAAVTMSDRQMAINEGAEIKKKKAGMGRSALNDTDDTGEYVDVHNPLVYGKDWKDRNPKRPPLLLREERKPIERAIEAKMNVPVGMHFNKTPLQQAISDLYVMHGINFKIDTRALEKAGISEDRPVSINLEQITLKSALKLLLKDVGLTYVIKDEAVQITTPEDAKGNLLRYTWQVADLVIPIENAVVPDDPYSKGMGATAPQQSQAAPAAPTAGSQYAPSGGTGVGYPSGGSSSASPFASLSNNATNVNPQWDKKRASHTMEDALINLITTSIEQNSWNNMGGPGTIQYFAPTMSLVINQTVDIQEQIQDLLASLRALQDQEVAIEVRFITIADDFYERIGVDFNLDIQTNKATAQFQPSLLQSQFAPAGFLNNLQNRGVISGLTPAGTLTNDLSIPIRANSFNTSFPQFGGYIPGTGGLNVGLAFLSDIQVFLFLEAVAGDVRTNVMTAPKLTLENGQISTIIVGEGVRNFLTTINYTVLNNQIVAQPIITSIAQNGVTLTIQAVISADRRFVRMNPTITLTNTSNTTPTATIPIQLPLYPTLTDFNNGQQPVVFTEYISAPSTNTIAVNTTVTVPDGGTVLMGGLKIMSEGRNEYGAPILSKIPYIDRLFRNTSFGRDNRSLMLMVTPRIIIQAEEEERQTGFVAPRPGQTP